MIAVLVLAGFFVLVLFFIVLFVVIAKFKVVEQPGSSSSPAPADWRGPEGSAAAGRWNGEILGTGAGGMIGSTLSSTFGVFEVQSGTMTFTPDGASAPDWRAACHTLVVARRGFMSLNGADVSITWPTGPGTWQTASCNVSRERINRMMGNDFKDLRERGYASEFVSCLAANGARVQA
ncbi:hypothetical protein [Nocardioides currus]|uniref:Uncharacterized protein n=1 Tax=Nocardioides currus TaxID=2133958 RepID=A0A2R7YYS6_9ACTN|nr:hypothetical protein [Nocardioides currus]PUA81039.1 hypothetical protein C7S10_11725 [Nocardioides currus]